MGFVQDEGDGYFNGRSYGGYIEDEANNILQLDATGKVYTNFILPDADEWFVFETYDINGNPGYIGLTVFSGDVTDLSNDIEALRQEAIALYTSFLLKVTHYKTISLVDIYSGDESNVCTLTCGDFPFTVPDTVWEIQDTIMAPTCLPDVYDETMIYNSENIATEFII